MQPNQELMQRPKTMTAKESRRDRTKKKWKWRNKEDEEEVKSVRSVSSGAQRKTKLSKNSAVKAIHLRKAMQKKRPNKARSQITSNRRKMMHEGDRKNGSQWSRW